MDKSNIQKPRGTLLSIFADVIEELLSIDEKPSDLIVLYVFYCYMSSKHTYITTQNIARALHWSSPRIRKAKNRLIEYGMIIDETVRKPNGRITGHNITVYQ